MVKKLRDKTGAGMMECKAALTEANGDIDEAIDAAAQARAWHRRPSAPAARPRKGIDRQLHPHGRQDRRARRGELRVRLRGAHRRVPGRWSKEIAMHIAAADPRWVRARGSAGRRAREGAERSTARRSRARQAGEGDRQDRRGQDLAPSIAQVVLLDQPSVRDPTVTVWQLDGAAVGQDRREHHRDRFARFKVGELLCRLTVEILYNSPAAPRSSLSARRARGGAWELITTATTASRCEAPDIIRYRCPLPRRIRAPSPRIDAFC